MDHNIALSIVIVGTSLAIALAALVSSEILSQWIMGRVPVRQTLSAGTVFLFDGPVLLNATPQARKMLSNAPDGHDDWTRLLSVLGPRFPGLAGNLAQIQDIGETELPASQGGDRVHALYSGGVTRISVQDTSEMAEAVIDNISLSAMRTELETLRQLATHMDMLAWQVDENGTIVWANRSYLSMLDDVRETEDHLMWPLPALFPDDLPTDGSLVTLSLPNGTSRIFESRAVSVDEARLHFALPADRVALAEAQLREFMQTLAKTFAGLPIGLAIFNRARNLVMFNPALIDLCPVGPAFLVGRPSLFEFLDALRDKNMIPEQRNYPNWRRHFANLEESAATGQYEEIWSLPSGQTYKVRGQPHPDGAIALLFEDITADISLTRRFRAELEMGQAVLDDLDEAVAVFSPAGILAMANKRYVALWNSDPSQSLTEIGIHDTIRLWQDNVDGTAPWMALRDMVLGHAPRQEMTATLDHISGAQITMRARPISGGAIIVGFRPALVDQADMETLETAM